ncbi:NAD(P)-binding domain-containing protein [Anaerococcus obesiensis]|uniref:NAD(P)-binding domain-containing protein n=1 Tax=Anaerococcus obesiensis TaxID=1287640 RepID=UPI00399635B2
MDKNKILEKIKDKSLKIGVVGLGYVGLPLAVEKAGAGFETTGFDVQAEKVEKVNNGINYIGDVIPEKMKQLVDEGKLKQQQIIHL